MSASVAAFLELKYPQIFVSVAYFAISSMSYIFSSMFVLMISVN